MEDLKWRAYHKPRQLVPSDIPIACSQRAWLCLTTGSNRRPRLGTRGAAEDAGSLRAPWASASTLGGRLLGRWRRAGRSDDLHPPHSKPGFGLHWRHTTHGMPVTLLQVSEWFPESYSCRDERLRHVAYHMEHYVRLMGRRNGRQIERCCILMDMSGFRPATLPHVYDCIEVLRKHYPGRLGCAAFINVPSYFYPAWKIISPWLDEEIMSKTHFLPAHVTDPDSAIAWIDNKVEKSLDVFGVIPGVG